MAHATDRLADKAPFPGPAAALLGLSAVSLDLETTGLHPDRDYILQIGAVQIDNGALLAEGRFERNVRPPIPIPEKSSRIHGLTDKDVISAEPVAALLDELLPRLQDRILIGYSIEFDLAMIAKECARNGRSWREPAWLDILLLDAGLRRGPPVALETLAERYGIDTNRRHTALADARIAAETFLALIPELREAGIRSLGQARTLQRSVRDRSGDADVAEWSEARRTGRTGPILLSQDESTVLRNSVDGYLFRTRAADIMRQPVIRMAPGDSLREAAQRMATHGVGSVVVDDGEGQGIVTASDMVRQLAAHGSEAATLTVGEACSRPLATVPGSTHLYRALARMSRHNYRHLGVADDSGSLSGIVSLKSVLRTRSTVTLAVGDRIDSAESALQLAAAHSHLPGTAAALFDDRLGGREVAEVLSVEYRALTRRAAQLAENDMIANGDGPPPAPYCLLVLGSAGRGESMLAPDQDNALIVDDGHRGDLDDENDWFAGFARRLNAILDESGIPLCQGKVMARERFWRRRQREWIRQAADWVGSPRPQSILNVDIFFDLTPVHGTEELATALKEQALALARQSPTFARAMGENATDRRLPVHFLGGFRTDTEGRVDLKGGGLFPLVSAARAMALRHRISAASTSRRLELSFAAAKASPADLEALLAAHETLLRLTLRQQIEDIGAGRRRIGNSVRVRGLGRLQRAALRDALRQVSALSNILPTVLAGN